MCRGVGRDAQSARVGEYIIRCTGCEEAYFELLRLSTLLTFSLSPLLVFQDYTSILFCFPYIFRSTRTLVVPSRPLQPFSFQFGSHILSPGRSDQFLHHDPSHSNGTLPGPKRAITERQHRPPLFPTADVALLAERRILLLVLRLEPDVLHPTERQSAKREIGLHRVLSVQAL